MFSPAILSPKNSYDCIITYIVKKKDTFQIIKYGKYLFT